MRKFLSKVEALTETAWYVWRSGNSPAVIFYAIYRDDHDLYS